MIYIQHTFNLREGSIASFRQYIEALMPMAEKLGVEFVAAGEALDTLPLLVGTTAGDQQRYFALFRYPSEQTFRDLVQSPAYQAITHLREGATTNHVFRSWKPWNPAEG